MGFADRLETEVALHPFLQCVTRFREDAGYSGDTLAALPSVEERLAELHALLNAPACPRPRTAFEAYCLVFQLVVAVDNRYFGPFNAKADNAARLGFPEVANAIGLADAPGATAMPFRNQLLVLDPAGGFHFRAAEGVAADAAGPFQRLRRYVEDASLAAPPAPGTSKRARLTRFLYFLQGAPRPASDLAALATVTRLLFALERRYCADAGAQAGEKLLVPLPFLFYQSPVFPGAVLLFTIAHVMAYYADGAYEIHECAASDGAARTGPVYFGRRVLKGGGR